MEAKLINLDFTYVGFKFSGEFTQYSKLIPLAVYELKQKNKEIKERTETLVILYEPCKGEEHKVGYFIVGYIIAGENVSPPEGAELITIKGRYATTTGTISQMADIYSYIGSWIAEQALQQIWPDTLHIEIYEEPLLTEITGNEKVQVCLPVY
jgi:hypothetical protein